MESLEAFKNRIFSFQPESLAFQSCDFHTNPNLDKKVAGNGEWKPFWGDTVVFDLEEGTKEWVQETQEALYQSCGTLLANRLRRDTFHMTLHDLSNGGEKEWIQKQMKENGHQVQEILTEIRREDSKAISMRTTYVFNMVNTSVVVGLEPEGEADYISLMRLYDQLEKVRALPYPLTPHITLAYYRPQFQQEGRTDDIDKLRILLKELSQKKHRIILNTGQLHYLGFSDMNTYFSLS